MGARRQHHEEHQNHERWVISYADMVTLLFALFVVLYALGEIKLQKLQELKQSLAFAFHFEGSGKTHELGEHERGDIGGDLPEGSPLTNMQRGPMREFLLRRLPEEFELITGRSLDVKLNNDFIRVSAPLSAYFAPGSVRLERDVHPWLTRMVERLHQVAAGVRVHVEAPKVVLSSWPDGSPYYSRDLCQRRLGYLQSLIGLMSDLTETEVKIEFEYAEEPGTAATWEDEAVLSFFFVP